MWLATCFLLGNPTPVQFLILLLIAAALALVFVGLPLAVLVYIIYKILEYRTWQKDCSSSR